MADGRFVAITVHPIVDPLLTLLARRATPWRGKVFADGRGENRLAPCGRWPARLLWPRHPLRRVGAELRGFPFALRPGQHGVALDYAAVPSNPRRLVRSITDEVVEVAPGTYLGRILWRGGRCIGWFELRFAGDRHPRSH